MILHESMEMYLETILILKERIHNVRAIDIGVRSAEFIDEFSGFEGISKNGERIVDE